MLLVPMLSLNVSTSCKMNFVPRICRYHLKNILESFLFLNSIVSPAVTKFHIVTCGSLRLFELLLSNALGPACRSSTSIFSIKWDGLRPVFGLYGLKYRYASLLANDISRYQGLYKLRFYSFIKLHWFLRYHFNF